MNALHERILLHLAVICDLGEHGDVPCKIGFRKGVPYVQLPSTFNALNRWVWGDSREVTLDFVRNVCEDCEAIIDYIRHSSFMTDRDKNQDVTESLTITLSMLNDRIKSVDKGLVVLQRTYATVSHVVGTIDLIRSRFKRLISIISKTVELP